MSKRAGLTLAEMIRAARAAVGGGVRITIGPDKTATFEPMPPEGARKGKEAALAPKREIVL